MFFRFENLFNKTINSIPNELLKLDKTENGNFYNTLSPLNNNTNFIQRLYPYQFIVVLNALLKLLTSLF